ncbi:MAG: DoxX family protein [Gammaproteobacteria bacterium]|nr:DoxX family protein [Gammaproteobacteria bacterium]MCZ6854248.1 DoxX family protein [Gammaproteobacteria bacterium]
MSEVISGTNHSLAPSQGLSEFATTHAHWALRIALASVFIYHGVGKLAGVEQFAQMMNLSYTVALLVALAEFVGGFLVVAGGLTRDWVTRLGASFFIPVMVGAIAMVHWGQWSFVGNEAYPMGGSEFQVTLLLTSLYFLVKGNRA